MVTEMLAILEVVTIAVSGFLIKKYVFLESDMEEKEQRIFYCASFFMIAILFLIFGKDTASLAALFLMIPFRALSTGFLLRFYLCRHIYLRFRHRKLPFTRLCFMGYYLRIRFIR